MSDGTWRLRLPAEARIDRLEPGLARFERFVADERDHRLGWFVVLGPSPMPPSVVAAGSLDVRPGPGIDAIHEAVEGAVPPHDVWSRRLERVELGGDPGLVCHDLVANGRGPEGTALHERGIAVRHVAQLGLDIVVDLSTDDLTGFDQIAMAAGQACARVDISVEGPSA